jgi:hypothetical protein
MTQAQITQIAAGTGTCRSAAKEQRWPSPNDSVAGDTTDRITDVGGNPEGGFGRGGK